MNVQHLESLNDQVAELTGVRVRETFPDTVLASADEIVLVDLTPQALIQRLREGKVYPPERVDAALNNFFKIENLKALREVALRQVAEDVEAKRIVPEALGTREDRVARRVVAGGRRAPARAGVSARPSAQRLARRAWRSAQRLGAELDLLYVKKPGAPPSGERAGAARRAAEARGRARRAPARRGGPRRGRDRCPRGRRSGAPPTC